MSLVVDASAAVAIARGGASRAVQQADTIVVPDLFHAEVTNAIWKYSHFGGVDDERCTAMLEIALGLPDEVVPSGTLCRQAWSLAKGNGRPVYDMLYLALARHLAAPLLTEDKALRRLARKYGVQTP